MCYRVPRKFARKQRKTTTFSQPCPTTASSPTTAITDGIYTVVNDREVYVRIKIEPLFNLGIHSIKCTVKIVTIGVFSNYVMHHRFILKIGFNAEGCVPVSVRPHPLGIEGLNGHGIIFQPLNNVSAIGPVIG